MCACKPLGSEELLSAVRLDPDNDNSHLDERVDEGLLLELCNNLLVLDSQLEVWRFSHLSVREYFEENHWDLWQAHCHAAKVCLELLIETYGNPTSECKVESLDGEQDSDGKHDSDDEHDLEPQDIFDLAHPFQSYSRHHWMIHVRSYDAQVTDNEQEADLILARLLRTFLGSPRESSAQYQGWYDQVASEPYPQSSVFSVVASEPYPQSSVFSVVASELYPQSFVFSMVASKPYPQSSIFSMVASKPYPQSSVFSVVDMKEISPKDVPIFAICRFSFYTLLRDWWDGAEIDVLQMNDGGENLLVLAAIASCKPICKNLVKRGIPISIAL